ncbi:hypothetical protein HDU83_001818, partial [Entophlyctis luteolus]
MDPSLPVPRKRPVPGRQPAPSMPSSSSAASTAAQFHSLASFDDMLKDLDLLRSDSSPPVSFPASSSTARRRIQEKNAVIPSSSSAAAPSMSRSMSSRSRTSESTATARPLSQVSLTSGPSLSNSSQPVSIGAQIVRGEREKREAERLQREAALAREREIQRQIEMRNKKEQERERMMEEELRRAEADKIRRAKERRLVEMTDSEERNAIVAARLGSGGIAVSRVLSMSKNAAKTSRLDESCIVPEYIDALMRTLTADKTISPTPEDFAGHDGYAVWETTIQKPTQEVIADLLFAKYIEPPKSKLLPAPIDIFFKVVEGHGLIAKEGRSRDAYCRIEFGQIPQPDTPPRTGIETFQTEVCGQSVSPIWNQHVDISSQNLTDLLIVSVWDQRKDDFLGRVILSVEDIVFACGSAGGEGFVSRWTRLDPRGSKFKDKYVGGEILLEMSLDMEKQPNLQDIKQSDPVAYIESQLVACKMNLKTVYATLLRSCLLLDISSNVPPPTQPRPTDPNASYEIIDLLSEESSTLLGVFERSWLIRSSTKSLTYLDLIFQKYKLYEVPIWALLNAYEDVHGQVKRKRSWLHENDKPVLLDILEEMNSHYRTQISNYKEYYPKNKPDEALESTILLLRMVFKNPIYREAHPNLPDNFEPEILDIMVRSSKERFKKLSALSAPLDENNVEEVIGGFSKLCELLVSDIVEDYKYFKHPFEIELDIVKLNSDVFFARFVAVLSSQFEGPLISSASIQKIASGLFGLLQSLRNFDSKSGGVRIKKSSAYRKFSIEDWMAPYVLKWLDHLSTLTIEWVTNAIKADNFEAMVSESGMGQTGEETLSHSSSIADLFTVVHKELDSIIDWKWTNDVQNATFIQKFAKTVYRAIENYCAVVGTDDDNSANSSQFTNFIKSIRLQKESKAPADITNESCVKLCNLEFALVKLDEMHKLMNVATLARAQKDYRQSMALKKNTSKASSALDDKDKIKGAFKIEVVYAENVKPVTKSGLANPYMVFRLPEGTVMPPTDEHAESNSGIFQKTTAPGVSVVLTGSMCELGRTRPINDTINPVWDESFSAILPPVSHLDVYLYSRNLISDELCGKTVIDLSGRLSRLRQKLTDHHTHDVYIEFDPQGRGLVRMTLEGEVEDVDYWFRKSRERLKRTQNDLTRALTVKISPYLKEVISKTVKEQSATGVSRGFFGGAMEYSNFTAAGVPIDQLVNPQEADAALSPLTEYLEKNLMTLVAVLSPALAHEVIKKLWDEVLLDIEHVLIPPLYGQLESTRRFLNKRQLSLCGWALSILRAFFHADGEALGLPYKILDNRKYHDISNLMTMYFQDLPRIKREYELSFVNGREKEMLIRLVRLRIEKQEEFTPAEREDGRKWVE